ADPPLTKDAVAGRIRRLLALADKRAAADGTTLDALVDPSVLADE
ncbi:MAG TPA: DNA-binding protein WhiA, partial [Mycobacteriales bacterium]|nr:DNA-binding protein WhiA [Mycobacteriales bacterium]